MLSRLFIIVIFTFGYPVDYYSEIQPIFDNNCGNCHLGNSSGGLNLSNYENLMSGANGDAVVIPFNHEGSELYDRITRAESEAGDMPPSSSASLTPEQIELIAQWIDEGCLEEEPLCDSGFTFIENYPQETTVVFDNSNCFYEDDLTALDDIITLNSLDDSAISLGFQNWINGRLTRLEIGDYYQGGNHSLDAIPESISNLDSLKILYLDKNNLTQLPNSITDLNKIIYLVLSFNQLETLPDEIGNMSDIIYLDLGYNSLYSLPNSVVDLEELQYLFIFGNELEDLPENFCDLDLNWSGLDYGFVPYFACGGNYLCENLPECVENSAHLNTGLDPNYYTLPIELLQDCSDEFCSTGNVNLDDSVDVLDVVMLVNHILGSSLLEDEPLCAGDVNSDGGIDVLDVVTVVNTILN